MVNNIKETQRVSSGIDDTIVVKKTTNTAGVHTPHTNIDNLPTSSTFITDQVTVTTAASEVVLGSDTTLTSGVTVKALSTNGADLIYVGLTGVSSSDGFELAAGEQNFFPIDNLNKMFIVASADSNSVTFSAS